MLNPYARESKARTRRFLRGNLISEHAQASSAQGVHRQGPRYYNFPYFCNFDVWPRDFFGLVDQNGLERDLSALMLRTLAVGRRLRSKSIEVTLHLE